MARQDGEALIGIVEGLYASAVQGQPWDVEAIRSWVGTECANICLISAEHVIYGGACSGLTQSDQQRYLRHWADDDALAATLLSCRRPLCTDAEAMTRPALEATSVFQGFYEPLGIAHQGLAQAPLADGSAVGISIQNGWPAGPVAVDALSRAGIVTRHLRRAVELGATVRLAERRLEASERLLAYWRVGLLHCQPDRRVVATQGGAEALLRRPEFGLRLQRGRLRIAEAAADRRFGELLQSPGQTCSRSLALRSSDGATALELTVIEGAAGEHLVVLRDATQANRLDLDHLRQRLGLTRTESEVLGHLMMGRDVQGIAEIRGCTLATIRSYLKTLRRKLDCSSQAQLVALGWRRIGFCPGAAAQQHPAT